MRTRLHHLHLKTNVPGTRQNNGGLATLRQLVVPFSVKAEDIDENARTFEGLAAVWDLDLGDDIIHKGAFKNTIREWKSSGESLPLLNSHDHWDIHSAIGQLLEAKETDDGLFTRWEVIEGPDGDAVLARLRPSQRTKRGVIGKMSIGYEPVRFEFEASDEARFGQIRHLKEVNLREVSLVIFPMAPGARINASTVKTLLVSAEEIDPQTVTPEMKTDLRRLASRIGLLLKGKKDETPNPNPGTPATPATPGTGTPTPESTSDPAAPSTPSTGDEGGNDGAEPTEPTTTPPADPATTSSTGEGKGEAPVYLYSDALKQRLQKTLLKATVSEVTNPNK